MNDEELTQTRLLALIVEDMKDLAFLLSRELRRAGLQAECVDNLSDALLRVQAGPRPNIVILDLSLPDSPKPEDTIQAIPALQKYAPVMVLSGHTHPDLIASVEQMGAVFHAKNIQGESFLLKIVRAIMTFRGDELAGVKSNIDWLRNFLAKHGH